MVAQCLIPPKVSAGNPESSTGGSAVRVNLSTRRSSRVRLGSSVCVLKISGDTARLVPAAVGDFNLQTIGTDTEIFGHTTLGQRRGGSFDKTSP